MSLMGQSLPKWAIHPMSGLLPIATNLRTSLVEVELKFGRSFEIESFHRLLITSNHTQVIQASSEARRFVVCDVSDARMGNVGYFDSLYAIADGRDDAAAQAFMHYLLNRDLSTFKPWAAQQQFLGDRALMDQKLLSLAPPLAWLGEVLAKAESIPHGQKRTISWDHGLPFGGNWPAMLHRAVVLEQFREWAAIAKPHGANTFTGSTQRFWSEIAKVVPLNLTQIKDANGNRGMAISLTELRARFRAYLRGEPYQGVTGVVASPAATAGSAFKPAVPKVPVHQHYGSDGNSGRVI
jgi:hypothetical protein